jgi:hypothetical protein
MDNLCNTYSALVVRYGYRIYDGGSDPYSAGDCYNSRSGTCYSGAKGSVKR